MDPPTGGCRSAGSEAAGTPASGEEADAGEQHQRRPDERAARDRQRRNRRTRRRRSPGSRRASRRSRRPCPLPAMPPHAVAPTARPGPPARCNRRSCGSFGRGRHRGRRRCGRGAPAGCPGRRTRRRRPNPRTARPDLCSWHRRRRCSRARRARSPRRSCRTTASSRRGVPRDPAWSGRGRAASRTRHATNRSRPGLPGDRVAGVDGRRPVSGGSRAAGSASGGRVAALAIASRSAWSSAQACAGGQPLVDPAALGRVERTADGGGDQLGVVGGVGRRRTRHHVAKTGRCGKWFRPQPFEALGIRRRSGGNRAVGQASRGPGRRGRGHGGRQRAGRSAGSPRPVRRRPPVRTRPAHRRRTRRRPRDRARRAGQPRNSSIRSSSRPRSASRPRWIRDLTVPSDTPVMSAISA